MKVKNLCFSLDQQGSFFFKNINFELERGKIHALHGKNGVGKSILLNVLSGKVHLTGKISGYIECEQPLLLNQRFDQMIADQFTFRENLSFSTFKKQPRLFSSLTKKNTLNETLIKKFNLNIDIPVNQLSGGQRQMLSLLMALEKKPTLLLMDEPTAALDEENAELIFEFLSHLKDITFLVVCHHRSLIEKYTTGSHLYLKKNLNNERHLEIISSGSFKLMREI